MARASTTGMRGGMAWAYRISQPTWGGGFRDKSSIDEQPARVEGLKFWWILLHAARIANPPSQPRRLLPSWHAPKRRRGYKPSSQDPPDPSRSNLGRPPKLTFRVPVFVDIKILYFCTGTPFTSHLKRKMLLFTPTCVNRNWVGTPRWETQRRPPKGGANERRPSAGQGGNQKERGQGDGLCKVNESGDNVRASNAPNASGELFGPMDIFFAQASLLGLSPALAPFPTICNNCSGRLNRCQSYVWPTRHAAAEPNGVRQVGDGGEAPRRTGRRQTAAVLPDWRRPGGHRLVVGELRRDGLFRPARPKRPRAAQQGFAAAHSARQVSANERLVTAGGLPVEMFSSTIEHTQLRWLIVVGRRLDRTCRRPTPGGQAANDDRASGRAEV